MNSLRIGRVAQILDKLRQDAQAADRAFLTATMADIEASGTTLEQAAAKMIAEERENYRTIYRSSADNFLAISPALGRFLYMIAPARQATRIITFGTSMGISTIYLTLDLGDLVKAATKALKLVPDAVPNEAKGADAIKKTLRSLGATVAGLGEMQNFYGSGHGQDGRAKGLKPRHARLAVGAAGTLAMFLFETHDDRRH
ncbi:MAG: abortive infection family protein [Methylocella sp.]